MGYDSWSDDYIAEISVRVLSDLNHRTDTELDNLEVKNQERKKNFFEDYIAILKVRKELVKKQIDQYVEINKGSITEDTTNISYEQKLKYLIETED